MTEEELAIALESLPSINAVSEARSPSGLEHGFTWTVTFFSAYTAADGSVELLKSNRSELAKPFEAANTVLIKTIRYANDVSGFFNLYMYLH